MSLKVFVQIPSLNEEKTLPLVLESIPKNIPGVDLEILVIDDGSTDKTVEVAKSYGVKHFVLHKQREGLARSFRDGVWYGLEHGADIVINTDGDNQYPQSKIPDLIQPIIDGKADIVVADRQTSQIDHFSIWKKLFQRFGSYIVSKAAGVELPDAASGFRAYSRQALIKLNILAQFSYTMDTIIQAGNKRIPIVSVPITTNPKTRESRLFKNPLEHILKSSGAIIRAYIMYKPYMVFGTLGYLLLLVGLIPFIRYLVLVLTHNNPGEHLQSLIIGAVLLLSSFLCLVLNIVADLIRTNRILLEETLEQIKSQRLGQ